MTQHYDNREYWTWRPAGDKPWIVRLFTKGRKWEDKRESKYPLDFTLPDVEDSSSSTHRRSRVGTYLDKLPPIHSPMREMP
jgi:AGZA family xanthine/uracil permease-like MFS transporter